MNDVAPPTFCPVYRAIGVLQEKWVLHIVRALLGSEKGFNELARAVGGCNSATLTQRTHRHHLLRLDSVGDEHPVHMYRLLLPDAIHTTDGLLLQMRQPLLRSKRKTQSSAPRGMGSTTARGRPRCCTP